MRLLAALLTAAVGLTLPSLSGEARAWPASLEGKPVALAAVPPADGLYVWVDDEDRVQARVLGQRTYRLTFALKYGQIYDLFAKSLDEQDDLEFDETRSTLLATIRGSDVREGVSFSIEGNRLLVSCETDDGEACPVSEVYLGFDSTNPAEVPFMLSKKD